MGGDLPGQTIPHNLECGHGHDVPADSSLHAYAPGPYRSTVTEVLLIRIVAHAALLA
jgi:hypothetical protein